MGFIEKYLTWFKWGGLLVVVSIYTAVIWNAATTSAELKTTKTDNGKLQQQVADQTQYLHDYQALVQANDNLRTQLSAANSQNEQLVLERQHANQTAALDAIAVLRDPTRSVYAKDSDCGEAGSYPTVFGTAVSTTQ